MAQVVLAPYSAANRVNLPAGPAWTFVGAAPQLVDVDGAYAHLEHTTGLDDSDSLDAYTWKVPSVVLCTWNPADVGNGVTLSNGNLTCNSSFAERCLRTTQGISTGKWYWEITLAYTGSTTRIGVVQLATSLSTYVGAVATSWGYEPYTGAKQNGASSIAYTAAIVNQSNKTFGIAVDMDAGTITIYYNGASLGTMYANLTGTVYPSCNPGNAPNGTITANFGQSAFTMSVPAGYNSGIYIQSPPGVGSVFDWTDKIISRVRVEINTREVLSGEDVFFASYAARENITGAVEVWSGNLAFGATFGWVTIDEQNCRPLGQYLTWADYVRDYLYANNLLIAILISNRSGIDVEVDVNAYRITVDYLDVSAPVTDQGLLWEI